jgi:hypothetical protein
MYCICRLHSCVNYFTFSEILQISSKIYKCGKFSIYVCFLLIGACTIFIRIYLYRTEAEFMDTTIALRFLGIILRDLRLEISVSSVTLQTSFKLLLLKGGGG